MLVEYNNSVHNADIKGDMVNIWKCVPVDGFERIQTRRGTVYYESFIPKAEVKEFFSVAFFVEKNNRRYIINSLQGDKMTIMCDDMEFAIANGFKEIEHGVWAKTVDKSFSDSFILIKYIQNSDEKVETSLKVREFLDCWTKYIVELNNSLTHGG